MARRRIGQESFGFAQGERGRNARLDAIDAALDWGPVAALLDGIHGSPKGEPAWPPLCLFKALLLGLWHDLSDVALAEALDDRASFRRFCGFASGEATPERTAFVRLRKALVERKLEERLFRAVVRQLEGRGLVVRTGTLVDATVIARASKTDDAAAWCVYAGPHRTPVKGYKAHVAADEGGGIVRRVLVTPANVHDSRGMMPVLPGRPGRVWADRACDSHALHGAIRERRGVPRIARQVTTSMAPAKAAARTAWNPGRPPHGGDARLSAVSPAAAGQATDGDTTIPSHRPRFPRPKPAKRSPKPIQCGVRAQVSELVTYRSPSIS